MNKNSAVLQGGARGSAGKGSKYLEGGAVDLSGARVQSGVQAARGSNVQITNTTTNSGLGSADVSTLLAGIFGSGTPAPAPDAPPIPFLGSLTPADAPPASPAATTGTPDASAAPAATDWSKYYWIGGIVLALLVLSFFFGKNKH